MNWTGSTPLAVTGLYTAKELKALQQAGLATAHDILLRLPRRYEDRTRYDGCDALGSGRPVCLKVTVLQTGWRHIPGRRCFEARVRQEGLMPGALLSLKWFHAPYVSRIIAAGHTLAIYGKPGRYGSSYSFINPEFEILENESAGRRLAAESLGEETAPAAPAGTGVRIHTDRLVPVYRGVAGISARRYRAAVFALLQGLDASAGPPGYDVAPAYPYARALRDAHFPDTEDMARKARRRFALDECFRQQFCILWRRRRAAARPGLVTASSSFYVRELAASLPFELTEAQKRCVREIRRDMQSPRPMNRLLQGDVGSGKTLVALCAMLMAVESGYEAALMAPTQILAEQHYRSFRRLLAHMDVRLALRTAARSDDSELSLEGRDDGKPKIVIGTHALLYGKNALARLGLAVIDEQHKFGVEQRGRLIGQGESPDVLVMTATPIPRTLTLTLYGDLDVSVIDELPAARGGVRTVLRSARALPRICAFMQEQMDAGRQIYIVSPLIEESETRRGKAARSEFERWKKQFPEARVGLLHGRLPADEKEAVMRRFHTGELQILVATTVVEVGVDVPNATIMLINDAEGFGLSQLHQLRGRIGRGGHDSYCILLSDARDEAARAKLGALCATPDGFEIAEQDFRLRGPGDVLGTAQSGLGSIRFPEWLSDTRLIHAGKRRAEAVLDADPDLSRPEHAPLRKLVEKGEGGGAVIS